MSFVHYFVSLDARIYEPNVMDLAGFRLQRYNILGIMGSVLLITFEVFVLHIVPAPLCTSIGSIVFKCEGKDTNLFSNIQIFNAEK